MNIPLEKTIIAFIIILLALIIIQTIRVIFLRKKLKKSCNEAESVRTMASKELHDLNAKHANDIEKLKNDYSLQIKHIREQIEDQKESLEKKSEKELLVDVMLALGGYANRLDRLEKCVDNENITELINKSLSDMKSKMIDIEKSISSAMENTTETIQSSIAYDINDIKNNVDLNAESLDTIKVKLDEINSCINDAYSYNSMANSLDYITSALDEIKNLNSRY